jgi:ABC-2 type transport system ATP-binding protein
VQEVSTRVAILHHGKLLALDTIDNLSKKLDLQPRLQINVEDPSPQIVEKIKKIKGVKDAALIDHIIEVSCSPTVKADIISGVEKAGGKIIDFKTAEPSLEDVFLKFTED